MKNVKEKVKEFLKSVPKEKLIISICSFMALCAIVLSVILFTSAKSNEKTENDKPEDTKPDNYGIGQLSSQKPNTLEYQSLGNGTCVVVGIGTFTAEELEIPEKSHFGDTVIGIASGAFEGCEELVSVHIPASVSNIGESVFVGCTSLALISVERSNTKFSSIGGILYSKNKSMLICYPAARIGSSYLLNPNVKSIANDAFYGVQHLSKINYEGSAAEFGEISIGEGNRSFTALPVTCNYMPSK